MMERRYPEDKLFEFYWQHDPEPDIGYGRDVVDAFTRLGYGGGAARALDYYKQVEDACLTHPRNGG